MQREADLLNEHLFQLGDRRGEGRLVGQQLPTHPGPLRTLTRIHEHRARTTRPVADAHDPLGRASGRQCLQTRDRLGPIPRTYRSELGIARPVMVERVGHISQPHSGAPVGHPLGQTRGRRGDPLHAFTRHHQRAHRRIRFPRNRTGSGACSTTTCAFVPAKPNDDTPARRGPTTVGHGADSVGKKNRVDEASIAGFNRVKCRLDGIWPRCTANTALMKPAIAAAASK